MEYEVQPCTEDDEKFIEEKIDVIDESVMPPVEGAQEEEFVYKIEDDQGNIIGGCILETDKWKNACLDILWVDEKYRRKGLGSALIREAEKAAGERGCSMIALGTFDFQARPLYEKHGYVLRGTLKDWPRGHENYLLTKRLDQPSQEYVPSNDLSARYEVKPADEGDEEIINRGLGEYNTSQVPREHKYIPLNKKLVDRDGNIIAAVLAGVGSWNQLDIDIIWVDEPYRNQGIGSKLLAEAEREGKEHGAYCAFVNAFDWQASLFRKHGYSICGELTDFPGEGHSSYELEKRF